MSFLMDTWFLGNFLLLGIGGALSYYGIISEDFALGVFFLFFFLYPFIMILLFDERKDMVQEGEGK